VGPRQRPPAWPPPPVFPGTTIGGWLPRRRRPGQRCGSTPRLILVQVASSFAIAARNNGFAKADTREVTLASVRAYREAMASFAQMGTMEISCLIACQLITLRHLAWARPPRN
jgi:hypothetical protein